MHDTETAGTPEYELTRHADARIRQRGIPKRILDIIFLYGNGVVATGGSAEAIRVSKLKAEELVRSGTLSADDARRAARVAIVVGDQGRIVTALHHVKGKMGRRYRKGFN